MLKLRRITSGASWIPQIDGLRFVAIMAVLLFHAAGEVNDRGLHPLALDTHWVWMNLALHWADRGVVLFFVISGYILARPFVRQYRLGGRPVKLGSYYLRRITRLEPPYVISLLICATAEYFAWHSSVRFLLPHLLASMFYVHTLAYGQISLINFVTWSLEIEVQFYILAPVLGMLYRIENTAVRRGVMVVLIAGLGTVSLSSASWIPKTLLGFAHYFLAGFLLADILEIPRHVDNPKWRWDLVSMVGWWLIFWVPGRYGTFAWLPFLILPVYLAAFHGKASNWFFRQPFVALTGGMCYSIYLMHMLIISAVFRVVKHIQFVSDGRTMAVQMLLLIPIVLAGSTLFFVLVERPCMDPEWPKKLWHGLRGRVSGH